MWEGGKEGRVVGPHPPSQLQKRLCLAEAPAWGGGSLSSSRSNWGMLGAGRRLTWLGV